MWGSRSLTNKERQHFPLLLRCEWAGWRRDARSGLRITLDHTLGALSPASARRMTDHLRQLLDAFTSASVGSTGRPADGGDGRADGSPPPPEVLAGGAVLPNEEERATLLQMSDAKGGAEWLDCVHARVHDAMLQLAHTCPTRAAVVEDFRESRRPCRMWAVGCGRSDG